MMDNSADNLEDNLKDHLKDNLKVNLKDNVEEKMEDILEVNLEDNIQDKMENNLGDNLADKMEDNLGDNLADKMEDNLGNESEDDLEDTFIDLFEHMCKDPLSHVSPDGFFSEVLPFDGTVEFIALVDSVQGPQFVRGKDGYLSRFKVVLTGHSWKVQLTIWEDDINRLKHFFSNRHVVHVDGAFSQERNQRFSLGNVPVDLTIKSNTIINVVGLVPESTITYIRVDIAQVMNHPGSNVIIEGFLKCEFTADRIAGASICIAAICQGKYKLEVRCSDQSVVGKFNKTSRLQLKGKLKCDISPPHLYVSSAEKITIMDGTTTIEELRKATLIPRKRSADNDEQMQT